MVFPFRVVLVDDHAAVRHSIRQMLDRVKSIRVVGEAKNGAEALEVVDLLDPDLVIMDIEMPVMDGLETARRLRAKKRPIMILILSGYNDRVLVEQALKIGVEGYLSKDDAPEHLAEVVGRIAGGERGFFSPQVFSQIK